MSKSPQTASEVEPAAPSGAVRGKRKKSDYLVIEVVSGSLFDKEGNQVDGTLWRPLPGSPHKDAAAARKWIRENKKGGSYKIVALKDTVTVSVETVEKITLS